MNSVNIIGRLTKDFDVKEIGEESIIAKSFLAVDKYMGKDKERSADFIPITAFGKTADVLSSYVKKGNKIGISGRISTGKYEKDGDTRYTFEVVVKDFYFTEKKE